MKFLGKTLCASMGALVIGLIAPATSEAAAITFGNRATWEATAGTPTLSEDFEGFVTDVDLFDGPLDTGPFTIQANGIPGAFFTRIDVPPFCCVSLNPTFTSFMLASLRPDWTMDLTFDAPLAAWGTEFVNGDQFGVTFLDLMGSAGLIGTVALPGGNGFFGFAMTAGEQVTSIHFRSVGQGAGIGLDNIVGVAATTVVTAVPEPTSLLLFGTGLVFAARLASRRRR